MTVQVLYFAALRELCGTSEETLELPATVNTLGALLAELCRRHAALNGRLSAVRVAKNETFAELGEALSDGDTVALIPPVAGG